MHSTVYNMRRRKTHVLISEKSCFSTENRGVLDQPRNDLIIKRNKAVLLCSSSGICMQAMIWFLLLNCMIFFLTTNRLQLSDWQWVVVFKPHWFSNVCTKHIDYTCFQGNLFSSNYTHQHLNKQDVPFCNTKSTSFCLLRLIWRGRACPSIWMYRSEIKRPIWLHDVKIIRIEMIFAAPSYSKVNIIHIHQPIDWMEN